MKAYDLVVIGGGSAGLASAVSAYENGTRNILVIEREKELGGILQQCIHNGFGLHIFGEEMTGPAYAERWIDKLRELSITYKTDTMVTHISHSREIEYTNTDEGYTKISARAVILAMGCRERTSGAIAIPGYRPAGVWTAGTAQKYLNQSGYMVGKKVFILGSGDIGLIMARRMVLEGAEVLGVAELMPYSNGLPRNIKQCLEDFDIPLYLSHTITDIRGKDRLEEIIIAEVDANRKVISGSEKSFKADTLLLSVGLIPENSMSEEAGVAIHPRTNGPIVGDNYETNVAGVFACGNVLHVHDLVDFVSEEGKRAGIAASEYLQGQEVREKDAVSVLPGTGVTYVIPHHIQKAVKAESYQFFYRVDKPYRNIKVNIYKDDTLIKTYKKKYLLPAEMEKLTLKHQLLDGLQQNLKIEVVPDDKLKAAKEER